MWTEFARLAYEYRANNRKIKALKARNEELRPRLIEYLGGCGQRIVRGVCVRYIPVHKHRFDVTALKAQEPAVYEKYLVEEDTGMLKVE